MPVLVDELLAEYKEHVAVHATVDYEDSSSVDKANLAADSMIAIAKRLAGIGEPALVPFASLLNSGDATSLWVAHHLLEHLSPDAGIERRALAVIEKAASGNDGDSMGSRMWLKEWRERDRRPAHRGR